MLKLVAGPTATPAAAAALQEPPRVLVPLVAEQLMSTPVVGLPMVVPVSLAESLLRYSQHNGFPVYDPLHRDPASGACRLDGFVLRSQIELLLHHRAYCDKDGRYLHLGQAADVDGFEEALAGAMAARLRHHPSGGRCWDWAGEGEGWGRGRGCSWRPAAVAATCGHPPLTTRQVVCACVWRASFPCPAKCLPPFLCSPHPHPIILYSAASPCAPPPPPLLL